MLTQLPLLESTYKRDGVYEGVNRRSADPEEGLQLLLRSLCWHSRALKENVFGHAYMLTHRALRQVLLHLRFGCNHNMQETRNLCSSAAGTKHACQRRWVSSIQDVAVSI